MGFRPSLAGVPRRYARRHDDRHPRALTLTEPVLRHTAASGRKRIDLNVVVIES
jgi:hypothetical protein